MKKLKFTCTNCDAKLRVPTHLAGVSAPCPKCGATITAPSDITQAVDDDEPRRASAPSPAPANTPRSPGRETSPSLSQAPSATALAEPRQQVASAPATAATMSAAVKATSQATPLTTAPPMPTPSSLPVAELPKTTSSVEVPTAPSRPLQPRPMTLPPAAEITPAFFTPPPPIMPLPPVAPEPDFRSEAPMPMAMPLPSASPVVVEVTTFPVPAPAPPPPASIITQPIQVKARPSDLPGVRAEVSGSSSLPRLDVSLAGHDASAAALSAVNSGQSPRTRVQLSQPGLETHKFSPDDFIVPPTDLREKPPVREEARTESPPALEASYPEQGWGEAAREVETPADYLSLPLPVESGPIPLEDLENFDNASEEGLSDFNESAAVLHETALNAGGPDKTYYTELSDSEPIPLDREAAAWSEEELPSDFAELPAEEQPWDLGAPTDSDGFELSGMDSPPPLSTQPQGHNFDAVDQYDEVPVNPLHAGSFGKLFSQQSDPSREGLSSVPQAPAPSESPAPLPRTIESLPSPIAEQLSAPESDVLDELFGGQGRSRGESKGLSKTAVVMISCLVGAAAVAVLMVVFLWQVLGGLDPAEAYKEGSLEETTTEGSTGKAKATPGVNEASGKEAPAMIDPVAILRESAAPVASGGESESPALSIDERVQQIVNGTGAAPSTGGSGGSVIGSPGLDLIQDPVDKFPAPPSAPAPAPGALAPAAAPAVAPSAEASPAQDPAAPKMLGPAGQEIPEAAPQSLAAASSINKNYHPAASFAAPGPKDSPLMRTNDVIDAFLRAPDWETRLKYTYQGDSLRPAIEDYYKKWPDKQMGRYSLNLFQMEQKVEMGGPYWVYVVSTNDKDEGFPLIIRVEEGNLKIDWQIYSEFYDKHFARFLKGLVPRPSTFRVIVEQLTEYYGPDRAAFTDLEDYYVYQVTAPYDEINEFAFVKKDSETAKKLQEVVGLGKQPLAVIITLDEKTFGPGVKHYVITDYLTEGWFR